jgi:hypothetical protein
VDVTGSIEHTTYTSNQGEERDSWDLLAERVTLPVPRAGQSSFGGGASAHQGGGFDAGDSVPF